MKQRSSALPAALLTPSTQPSEREQPWVTSTMRAREQNRWSNWILLGLVLLAIVLFSPMLSGLLGGGVGLALGAIYLLAYLFAIIALPLMFFALLRFGYTVFARPYVRLWHIRRIRNARYLKEVLKRGR